MKRISQLEAREQNRQKGKPYPEALVSQEEALEQPRQKDRLCPGELPSQGEVPWMESTLPTLPE